MTTHRYRVVEMTDPDGTPQWQIRGVGHDEHGTPVSYTGPAVALASHDDGMPPIDELRAQVEAMLAALDEPPVSAAGLAVDGAGRDGQVGV